ncbi:hypothetical protein L9F63_015749, partial [Diploptera punctata]
NRREPMTSIMFSENRRNIACRRRVCIRSSFSGPNKWWLQGDKSGLSRTTRMLSAVMLGCFPELRMEPSQNVRRFSAFFRQKLNNNALRNRRVSLPDPPDTNSGLYLIHPRKCIILMASERKLAPPRSRPSTPRELLMESIKKGRRLRPSLSRSKRGLKMGRLPHKFSPISSNFSSSEMRTRRERCMT